MPIDEEMYKIRIEGAQEAIKRSRLVFLIITIISLAFIISVYNAYFSWSRRAVVDRSAWAPDDVTKFAQEQQVEEWVKSRSFDVSLLGIHIGASDAAPLGSTGLFVLSIWLFLTTRRENHAIASLLRDTKNSPANVRQMIFHGISSYLVFLTLGPGDEPIESLEAPVPTARRMISIHALVRCLFFLAPAAIVLFFVSDILTIFVMGAAFRYPHAPLFDSIKSVGPYFQMLGLDVFALLIASWTGFLSWRSLKYEVATGKIMREYADKLSEPN